MITFNKHSACLPFGSLKYTNPEDAAISTSLSGVMIREQIEITPSFHPEIDILDYVIMPDHVHILIQIKEPMNHHIGDIIQAIKSASTSQIRKITGNASLTVFEDGFHDRIISSNKQLETVKNYLRDNPRRLAVRKAHPEFFRRVNRLKIGEGYYQAYGNFQLLANPFREQVIVHRADSPEVRERNRAIWLYSAANAGVLVSPFISRDEKAIRTDAEDAGGRFIIITDLPMDDRYKPSAHDFALCESGRMLIVSAGFSGDLSRRSCLAMNALAKKIAGC